jgi:hypothetical protein
MEFINERGNKIDIFSYERDEQLFAEKYITPECVVLELGARYGTVSCVINKKISDPKNQVSVEPDEEVWKPLFENMKRNKCDFSIIYGVISSKPVSLIRRGSATRSVIAETSKIASYSLEDIELMHGLKFNTLVADCEGFLETFFDENPKMYEELSLIIMEEDFPNLCNYAKIEANLVRHGFKLLESVFYGAWCKVWKK